MIKSWMIIGGVTILLALLSNRLIPSQGARWFRRLQRPRWLVFERFIPFIWIFIFICGAASATLVWEKNSANPQVWLWMGSYLLLEVVTLAYTPAMLWLRRLRVGTLIGGTSAILGILLTISVASISIWASILLIPYVVWSPVGTYTTWEMSRLNPLDA